MCVLGYSVFDKEIKKSIYNNNTDCKCMPACKYIEYNYESVDFFRNWSTSSTKQ